MILNYTMSDIELKKEFASYCYGLSKIDNEWTFCWDLFDRSEEKFILHMSKMKNLVNLLNENELSIINLDIETEVWNMI